MKYIDEKILKIKNFWEIVLTKENIIVTQDNYTFCIARDDFTWYRFIDIINKKIILLSTTKESFTISLNPEDIKIAEEICDFLSKVEIKKK